MAHALPELWGLGREHEALSTVYERRPEGSDSARPRTRSLDLAGLAGRKASTPVQRAVEGLGGHLCKGVAMPRGEEVAEVAPGILFRHHRRDCFAHFREIFGISEPEYQRSLGSLEGGTTQSSGKSGSLFFFSQDRRYVLKTISEGERDKLLDMFPAYVQHFEDAAAAGRQCLLSRLFGLYSLGPGPAPRKEAGGRALHLLVMDNVFSGAWPDRIYDLKGTTEDRFVEPSPGRVLKDLNFDGSRLCLPEEQATALLEAIRLDTEFLEDENIMDYSLILGVFDGGLPAEATGSRGAVAGSEWVDDELRPAAFRMAIIDVLISWTLRKRAAHWLKKPTLGCCHEIDTEPPEYYRERFVDYFEEMLAPSD